MYASYLDYGKNRFSGATYGNSRDERGVIAIPRFVLAGDYKFNRWFRLGAEIEFEAGGTGVAVEYETGAAVEVELGVERARQFAMHTMCACGFAYGSDVGFARNAGAEAIFIGEGHDDVVSVRDVGDIPRLFEPEFDR